MAFKASLPVLFGYVPLGAAFGLLFSELAYPWYFATLMGVLVFAGSAQFLAVGLLAAQARLVDVALATLLLNARHLFYGFSLLSRFPSQGWRKWYLIFGLTDETYALLAMAPPREEERTDYYLVVTALNHLYWIAGCTLGAVLGQGLPFDTTGLDFALTALFVVLLIEQIRRVREPFPFLVALLAGIISLLLLGADYMLLAALILTMLMLLGRRQARAVR